MTGAARRRRNRARERDRQAAERAYLEAQAWALSIPGTPYGVTQPVRTQEELQKLLQSRQENR